MVSSLVVWVGNYIDEVIFVSSNVANKYIYTLNHKRLGLNYFYFSMITGLSGAALATAIRLEMSYPGSSVFAGDSLRYLQVITAHALIMIFFVVVPIFFGGFANFLIPYHVGSNDVAFPSLNSIGFWIQPCGFLLIANIGLVSNSYWVYTDNVNNYFDVISNESHLSLLNKDEFSGSDALEISNYSVSYILKKFERVKLSLFFQDNYDVGVFTNLNLAWNVLFWNYLYTVPEGLWALVTNSNFGERSNNILNRCAYASQTVSGWTFITPFSSNVKYTGVGVQDMLILGVYFAGISTTISVVNLLATRSTLAMPGLSNSRILLPFISISLLLMLRALAVITPILGSAMLMLLLDSHWNTSFFDFAYGGDPVFFHHLFWFFGHPEVYVLIIPAFGIVNSVLPLINASRLASKHHLIWAVYIMNYMGFLVWGHHMYLIGLDHSSSSLYSTITIMISLPATVNVINWTYSLLAGSLNLNVILLSFVSFFFFFLVAGLTGMWLSHVSLNISMHDTMYVVAHFHLMLSGAVMMAIFLGFYYYFSIFFQIQYSRIFAYLHIILYTIGQWMTFLPLFWVSFAGLPRSVHDFPWFYTGWQSLSTVGYMITLISLVAFYCMFLDSNIEGSVVINEAHLVPSYSKRCLYYINNQIMFTLYNTNHSKFGYFLESRV